jgi:hypothetical protein
MRKHRLDVSELTVEAFPTSNAVGPTYNILPGTGGECGVWYYTLDAGPCSDTYGIGNAGSCWLECDTVTYNPECPTGANWPGCW